MTYKGAGVGVLLVGLLAAMVGYGAWSYAVCSPSFASYCLHVYPYRDVGTFAMVFGGVLSVVGIVILALSRKLPRASDGVRLFHVPRAARARVGAVLLGIGLILAAGFGVWFAPIRLYDIGHAQQGASCRVPPQSQACADLANQALLWNGVIVLAGLAFVAGAFLLIPWRRRVARDGEPRPPGV
ncbi:MAG TPA: hypothetical protein VEY12_03480 [Thermoplasmata archaeon]|nr:hypothetical protein [Thermoplasmata archaeon]